MAQSKPTPGQVRREKDARIIAVIDAALATYGTKP